MTDVFSEDGIKKLSVGQTLTFMLDNQEQHYIIKKIKDGRIFVKEIHLYKPEEVMINTKDVPVKGNWKNKVK